MSDRMDAVLASIDTELAKCICGNPIPQNGPSLDYCSPACQRSYITGEAITEPYPCPVDAPDGRAINEEVNRRFRSGAYTDDPFDGLMRGITERLAEATRRIQIPDLRNAATFQRAESTEQISTPGAGRTVTYQLTLDTSPYQESINRLAAALQGISTEQAAENLRQLSERLFPSEPAEPPPTGEEFRRRALEARQNRGTGPQRRDNRRWRRT